MVRFHVSLAKRPLYVCRTISGLNRDIVSPVALAHEKGM